MSALRDRLAEWFEQQWYAPNPRFWLKPPAGLFGQIARLRRRAYQNGWKHAEQLPVPVIVIGNLTVGGTGKTPLTIWLVECLRGAGYRPGVVSRGYGGVRHSRAPLVVESDSDPSVAGDEPVLIARRTRVPVAVATDRVAAGRLLLAQGSCDVIVADDGLQHYRLARDLEILLIDGERNLGNGYCLPAGPLREPQDRLDSVDFIVRRGGQPLAGAYTMSVAGILAVNLESGERVPLTCFATQRVLAVAGIGHPERFFRDLRAIGLSIETKAFPDHYRFRAADIASGTCDAVLMTEKDAVKCEQYATERHWYVPIEARLPPEFGSDLLQRLKTHDHGQATPRHSGVPGL